MVDQTTYCLCAARYYKFAIFLDARDPHEYIFWTQSKTHSTEGPALTRPKFWKVGMSETRLEDSKIPCFGRVDSFPIFRTCRMAVFWQCRGTA